MGESDQSALMQPPSAGRSARAADLSDDMTAIRILSSLTDKQRAVLDLLIEHRTSKEISRVLGISHHTVDQRIMLARAKLGVATRGEVAQAYRRLLMETAAGSTIYERSVYDFSDVAPPMEVPHDVGRENLAEWLDPLPDRNLALPRAVPGNGQALAEPYHHVLPEMFYGPYGTFIRLGTIAVFALFLILVVLGGLAMFAQLSQIIDH